MTTEPTTPKYRTREQFQSEVLKIMWQEKVLTRLELAQAMNRKKTPDFIQKVEQLVSDGYLNKTEIPYKSTFIISYQYIED